MRGWPGGYQSVSYFTVPPRAHPTPLHRLTVRFRHPRSNTSTEYSLPGAAQLSQVRSISPSGQGVPCRFLPCTATCRAGLCEASGGVLGVGWGGVGGCAILTHHHTLYAPRYECRVSEVEWPMDVLHRALHLQPPAPRSQDHRAGLFCILGRRRWRRNAP